MTALNSNSSRLANKTHEGAPAPVLAPPAALRRAVLACLLWDDQFYEEGVEIAGRLAQLVPQVPADAVAALAVEARERMHLRHAPLLLAREMARHASHRGLVADTLARIVQRADELGEFVALYWKDGRVPLSAQVKKGLAAAFPKFDEYQLAKYDRARPVRLRDVLFLCHPAPRDAAQTEVWKRLAAGELSTPDTWEVALSAGGDPRSVWERLLREGKLGGLALLRNLRNMREAGVDENLVLAALASANFTRVLPFRFLAAARHAPHWEAALEQAMFGCLEQAERLPGRTLVLVDVSGSMIHPLSRAAETLRVDAAYGLAVLLREIAESVEVFTFSDKLVEIPPRRGFALRDAMEASQRHNGTRLGAAVEALNQRGGWDRLIVITDEQAADRVRAPAARGVMINVAGYRNGVGYGLWLHIDGWSEAVLDYVRAFEQAAD